MGGKKWRIASSTRQHSCAQESEKPRPSPIRLVGLCPWEFRLILGWKRLSCASVRLGRVRRGRG